MTAMIVKLVWKESWPSISFFFKENLNHALQNFILSWISLAYTWLWPCFRVFTVHFENHFLSPYWSLQQVRWAWAHKRGILLCSPLPQITSQTWKDWKVETLPRKQHFLLPQQMWRVLTNREILRETMSPQQCFLVCRNVSVSNPTEFLCSNAL